MSGSTSTRGWRRARVVACLLGAALLAACGGTGAADDDPAGGDGDHPGAAARNVDAGKPVSDEHIAHLTVGISGQIPLVDPAQNIMSGLYVNANALETLLQIDGDGNLAPWLAADWQQVSDTVYEYTLREGVMFWDGTELTAEDVKYAWDRMAPSSGGTSTIFAAVASIEAPDRYTVRVTLRQPDASWQYVPAMFYSVIYQKAHAEQTGEEFGRPATLAVGTGPWRFDSLNPTSGMELSAHEDYWGGKPPIDRVSVKFFTDDNSMALAMRAGEIDIAPGIGQPEGFVAAAGTATTYTTATCATSLVAMPTRTAPWDDIHVRRAVAHAINRDDIIAATQGQAGAPLHTLIAPQLFESLGTEEEVEAALEEVETYPYDVEAAKAELAQSSVPDGFSYDFTIPGASSAVAQVISAQLAEIGIDATVEVVPDTAWFGMISEGDPMLTFSETGACTPDPDWDSLFLDTDDAGEPIGLNLAQYTPPEVKALLEEGLLEQDPAERLRIYTELSKRVAEDVPYVPVYAEGNTYASADYDIVEYDSFWMSFPWLLNVVAR
ncbi:ABC transporter substrate-binding protein [Jiangella sp. DSM 45060]|uniref:ABC transporter substrate-binding protein n=1 Tax=Jiangella sp. DSM 45060 TaxID=1798224 RepID=UPI00087D749A|nr:ABC transporter substrate-binding protein [Jiangella sp. DSM 45060]SDT15918.1 peptide/nickel transport system substrate-binding protein [Jiangella sp. DSM 45060]